ncbi:class I SAM-dependent DNA methyltransferase [Pseudopontixanthobacter vadosimaris]|uniref:class I SAM-dependent DNA methyltransferase n=1 Tax=Pseudopontixanthobacter vadosimaris TaxID=2726450 RepID=UPI001475CB72|nr:class I SAM-dependent DNA methyltransferase [Pseudopontixanthobacter vadosimaris]
MNPVEIEEAVSQLASEPFERADFPFHFLAAFGNKKTTVDRLRKGNTNQSDLTGGVLQRSNIHIATCGRGAVGQTLTALRDSPKTASNKAKFILATDGEEFQAEDLTSGETVACDYADFPNHFGFFLPLAGITTVQQIRESSFDIRATGRLNKLYVTLLQDNPEWASPERRTDMNHFMARLIFCFFAEDTDIFPVTSGFTQTVERMSAGGADNTAEVISELFCAMNTKHDERDAAGIGRWASGFPYVNGNLFSGSTDVPRFSKIARSYLIHIGNLDWTKINPDIFGSMIQAVADDEERGALGMHYTSVPNILKVLNPLFLDDLRTKLGEAGENSRKLLNLRNRIAKIRVFDPACGSGNFLVIAYKEMRGIEAAINKRRGEPDRKTEIPLTNFRGIELRDFPAEIARLALIIAEYQSDVLYRGQKEALAEFLPLDSENWITCGNALRLDWLSICPPIGTGVKVRGDDLFETPLDQSEIDFENEGGETYICGNPPYAGSSKQTADQKAEVGHIFADLTKTWRSLDLVDCWFKKAADFFRAQEGAFAFVATNSICQGEQVPILWPIIYRAGSDIFFAHTSFKWANLASNNAGVTVIVVGCRNTDGSRTVRLYSADEGGSYTQKEVSSLNAYLIPGERVIVEPISRPLDDRGYMIRGNMPTDGGHLLLTRDEKSALEEVEARSSTYIRRFVGAQELINGLSRYCLWIEDNELSEAKQIKQISDRIEGVSQMRSESSAASTREWAKFGHKFRQIQGICTTNVIIVPRVTSENRDVLPVDFQDEQSIVGDRNFAICDAPLWNFALIASRLHWVWVGAISARLEMRLSYANTLCWNTFPLPKLTEQNKADLTHCAENILLTREAHFPATIADLYDPEAMPEDLRRAHEENDEVLERIYIGRRFRNDTERLEKLFELYTKMTGKREAA